MDNAVDTELVEHFVEHFDHHDPRLGNVSHAVYAEMLKRCPVAHSDQHGGFWIVNSYELAHEAYQSYDLFTAYPTVNVPAGMGHRRPLIPVEIDPPTHGKYRSLLAPVFAPARVEALEPVIRAHCDGLIDAFVDRGRCEFISELSSPLPGRMFCSMMGVPIQDTPLVQNWKETLIHGHASDPDGTKRKAAGEELQAYLAEIYEDRKDNDADDLVSVLIRSEVDGQALTKEEVLDITFLLMIAGLDTVTAELGFQFLYLAQHPEQRDRLVNDPSLIPFAVEELLRYESLVLTGRTVTRDVEWHGFQMKQGDRMLINSVAAGRDEAQFPNANEVIFERSPNRHLAFAAGPHRCVGSHLARLEMKVVHEHMHRRVPNYRLADGADIHRHASSVAGLDVVPLVWE
jgi:cytochrome P450